MENTRFGATRFVVQTEISLFAVKLYLRSDQQDRLFKGNNENARRLGNIIVQI
jgi:hypothetical protein